ncbi:MAG: aspartate kinase [Actinomycetota bacterium]|nr:aspartate kinase [Actinomycetota bacterium]
MSEPLVIKFGGTSVGDGAAIGRAARIVAGAARERPVSVVASAMSGTTDTLLGYAEATAKMAAEGTAEGADRTSTGATSEGSIAELHRTLAERHLRAARETVSEEYLPKVEERLQARLDELTAAISAPADEPDARRAEVAVYGERLSAEILAGAINSAGAPADVVIADPIATDSGYAEAEVDAEETRARCTRYVRPFLDEGLVAVVPGYGGRSPEGRQTTLGRGGSDLSATVIGRGLGSREVWIMSDVDGVLDADPRLVPDASLLPRLSYREAGVFAELGAKILHHRTMEPAAEAGIEVLVRNTFNPDSPGTRVTALEEGAGVRCIALRRDMAVEVPCTSGHRNEAAVVVCIGAPEKSDIAQGRKLLRKAGISVLHFGKATAGLVFLVPEREAEEALRVLHGALVTVPEAGAFAGAGEVA